MNRRNILVSLSIVIVIFFLICPLTETRAWTAEQNYVRNPANIPDFKNYSTSKIAQGSSGIFSFTITNRYNKSIENVTVVIEIYSYADARSKKNIVNVMSPPGFTAAGAIGKDYSYAKSISSIDRYDTKICDAQIKTLDDTPLGTYYIRSNLTFTYSGHNYKMLSLGYYSDADWKYACNNSAIYDESGIDVVFLYNKYGSISIIPDIAFSVVGKTSSANDALFGIPWIIILIISVILVIIIVAAVAIFIKVR